MSNQGFTVISVEMNLLIPVLVLIVAKELKHAIRSCFGKVSDNLCDAGVAIVIGGQKLADALAIGAVVMPFGDLVIEHFAEYILFFFMKRMAAVILSVERPLNVCAHCSSSCTLAVFGSCSQMAAASRSMEHSSTA